jgi:hypothetical protein
VLRHVLFEAALAAACHSPMLKPVARRLKEGGKPHKGVIIAIVRRLIPIANAVLKTGGITPSETQLLGRRFLYRVPNKVQCLIDDL